MSEIIPAILVVSKVTYGAVTGKKDYYYYRCYYNDKYLLVPYKVDYKQFNKNFVNKYVLIKHIDSFNGPIGQIIETLGPVTDIGAYKKWLLANILYKWPTMPLTIPMNQPLNQNNNQTNTPVYTIDPKGSIDLDDAFSINYCDNKATLTIMVANVPMSVTDNNTVKSISTIYTTDANNGVVHMLGKDVKRYSLLADNTDKWVLCLDVIIDSKGPINHRLYNKKVIVSENFTYETKNNTVDVLIQITRGLNDLKKYVQEDIVDSHKAVEYIMIYFSAYCANILKENNTGIFRIVEQSNDERNDKLGNNKTDVIKETEINNELSEFLKHWEKNAMYTKEPIINKQFNSLYVHVTSPIRRFVDCINMYFINCIINEQDYYMTITDEFIELLNKQNKFIKKIQTSINMLNIHKQFPDNVYTGYVIDKTINNLRTGSASDVSRVIIYTIYIPEISLNNKIVSFITVFKCHETVECPLKLYGHYPFKMYLFENKNNFKQKLKIMPMT